ncbi:MAG: enoyl-CoA hydratase [Flavobacteriales bacterium]|nr:enoyl-CoA hydratase [Flavobacteriales bacterium]|tara:strand:- start:17157 stop:17930 length:774 start_codon:yes stop_codon:yes gene_type:complete
MIYENILSENKDGVCYLTINRPKQLNALNGATILELSNAIKSAEENNLVRCIILTGADTRAFVAGADIKEFSCFNVAEGENLARKGQEMLFDLLENIGTPSIAAINGFALGGGLELAMSCHIRIASENAKMGLPEVSLGVIPGYGGTQRLANLVGKGKAIEMIITAMKLTAVEAEKWGLVNYVCPQDELMLLAEKIAEKIKRNSPMAIGKAIKTVNAGFIDGVDGFEVEKKEFGSCFGSAEFIEGTTAFMEKRKANF